MSSYTYAGTYYTAVTLAHSVSTIVSGTTIDVATGADAVYGQSPNAFTLYNDGLIEAPAGIAVDLRGGGLLINGSATDATALIYGTLGVLELGSTHTVVNYAKIEASAEAIQLPDGGYITNASSGTILSTGSGSTAIEIGASGGSGTVVNDGFISVQFESTSDEFGLGIGIELQNGGSVDNAGDIDLVHGSGIYSGMIGITLESGGTVTNTGRIVAGVYGTGVTTGAMIHFSPFGLRLVADQYTGLGVGLNNATLFNSGTGSIYGRNVGVKVEGTGYVDNSATIGGRQAGIQLVSGSVENSGVIESDNSYAGGVYMEGGSLTNSGTIEGGLGFYDYGIYVANNATVEITNLAGGLISGVHGIDVYGSAVATIDNAGTIDGATYAVNFGAGGGTLIGEAGADFIGIVQGDNVATLVLESGSSAGTIDGIYNFGDVIFKDGASWVFDGPNTITGGLTVNGGTVTLGGDIYGPTGNAIDFTGSTNLLVLEPGGEWTGSITGNGAGSTLDLVSGGVAGTLGELGSSNYISGFDIIDEAAGATWVIDGIPTIGAGVTLGVHGTVTNPASDELVNDGLIKVNGGTLTVVNTLTGPGTVELLNGGTLVLDSVASAGTIDFADATGVVKIGDTAGISLTVEGMVRGDEIDLTGVAYDTGHMSATTANGHIYVFDNGVQVAELALSGLSGNLSVQDDGTGHTEISVVCFLRGTRILTERGEVAVETLAVGDRVATFIGKGSVLKPIKWIGRGQPLDAARHPHPDEVYPIRIRKGAFDENVPHRDLLVSPRHAILVGGVLIPACRLVNGVTIFSDRGIARPDYYHVELEGHDVLLAEGLAVESYLDDGNRCFFDAAAFPRPLHARPDGERARGGWCVPLAEDGLRLAAARRDLYGRLAALGYRIGRAPALRFLGDGAEVAVKQIAEGVYRVWLPTGCRELALISEASTAGATEADSVDERRLGVLVTKIDVVTTSGRDRSALADASRFGRGWHEPEAGAHDHPWRWTDGDARLSVGDARLVEITIGGAVARWLPPAQVPSSVAKRRSSAAVARS
ncbi:MAG TPA: Hint domain-containing protein [Stellaceae bacterium]|nr:Hint domain-containing protein [Stellaceae bacterium]